MSVSKFNPVVAVVVADVSDPLTLSHSMLSCLLFAVCVDYDVSECEN